MLLKKQTSENPVTLNRLLKTISVQSQWDGGLCEHFSSIPTNSREISYVELRTQVKKYPENNNFPLIHQVPLVFLNEKSHALPRK